jgi:hypothetical protein
MVAHRFFLKVWITKAEELNLIITCCARSADKSLTASLSLGGDLVL